MQRLLALVKKQELKHQMLVYASYLGWLLCEAVLEAAAAAEVSCSSIFSVVVGDMKSSNNQTILGAVQA